MIEVVELHALADGELAGEREHSLRALLIEDPHSRQEFEAIVTVKTVLRERVQPVKCEAEWKACSARLNELARVRRVERVVSSRFAWGLSGLFFVTILIAGGMHRGTQSANTNSAELTRMISSLQPAHDVGPTATKETKHLVDVLLKLSQGSVDPQRMSVLNHSFGELEGRIVNMWKLRDASGDLALVVVPDVLEIEGTGVMRRDHSFRLGHVGTVNSVAWTDGRNTLLLVADRPYEDLATTGSMLESVLSHP